MRTILEGTAVIGDSLCHASLERRLLDATGSLPGRYVDGHATIVPPANGRCRRRLRCTGRSWPISAGHNDNLTLAARSNLFIVTSTARLRDIAGGHALDPGPLHPFPRGRQRAFRVDGATCIVNHRRRESQFARVERGPRDAEIRRKPADVDVIDAALLQITAEARSWFFRRPR